MGADPTDPILKDAWKKISTQFKQDMAPYGGYADVAWKRFVPVRGPPSKALFIGVGIAMIWSMTARGETHERRERWKKEREQAYRGIWPFFEALNDRKMAQQLEKQELIEEILLRKKHPYYKFEHYRRTDEPGKEHATLNRPSHETIVYD